MFDMVWYLCFVRARPQVDVGLVELARAASLVKKAFCARAKISFGSNFGPEIRLEDPLS